VRLFISCLFLLAHGLCLADEEPAVIETARRLRMPVDVVEALAHVGCESGRPNEQFICASVDLTDADLELDRILGVLVSELKDQASRDKLAASQAAWIVFRDQACVFEADGYSRSPDLGTVMAGCKATHARQRSESLQTFIGCGERYGCPGYK